MTRNYPEELNRLLVEVENHERSTRSAAPAEYVEVLCRLRKLWVFYRYLVDRSTANDAPRGVRILYAKISNCLIAIFHLLQQGYPGPAAMVIRPLFESCVHLQVILKEDVHARSQLFEDFIHVELAKTYSIEAAGPEIARQHQQKLAEVRDKYHPDEPRSWCWSIVPSQRTNKKRIRNNPSPRELCGYIGHPEYYDRIYGRLSAAIHPVPSYESWLRREEGGPMELGPQFSSRIKSIADLAIALGTDSFIDVIKFLQPEDMKILQVFVMAEVLKFHPEASNAATS